MRCRHSLLVCSTLLVGAAATVAAPPTTAFTYQGRLNDSGAPATGLYDMRFKLFSAPVGGAQLFIVLTYDGNDPNFAPIDVVSGMFRVELDFGQSFNADWWLNIEVKPHGAGPWTTLTPRQHITGAPYALYALAAPGSGTWYYEDDHIINANLENVGIGVEGPLAKLHVRDQPQALSPAALWQEDLLVQDGDAVLGLYSDAAGANGSSLSLAEVSGGGALVDKWTIGRQSSPGGGALRITYGAHADFGANTPLMAIAKTGDSYFASRLAIGTSTPTARLHVGGTPGVDGIRFPDGTLQTTAAAGGGFALPYSGSFNGSDQTAFSVNQTGIGYAASFAATNSGNYYGALGVSSAGVGAAIFATNSSGGRVAQYQNVVVANDIWPTLHAKSFGLAPAIFAEASVGTDGTGLSAVGHGAGDGVRANVDGSGNAIEGTVTNSFGRAGYFEVTSVNSPTNAVEVRSAGNTESQALYALHTGAGDCALFQINNPANFGEVVEAVTNGSGDAIQAINSGTGMAGYFAVTNAASSARSLYTTHAGAGYALYARQTGVGAAAYVTIQNSSSSNTALYATSNGTGAAGNFQCTNSASTAPALVVSTAGSGPALLVGGLARVDVLEIEGGADLSEGFDVADDHATPGMVVVIDPQHPGRLRLTTQAYDRKVAGIIAGAGGVKPGMVMKQAGSAADGEHPVALTGRVYCLVDAAEHAVAPGDLLVTSATPGHAMKAADHERSQGAIIGKAMTPLAKGEVGLVLVLVSLQ